jgi:hypothetical protein
MLDIEFISELAVAILNGLQNKKKHLEEFYQQYETTFDQAEELRTIFVRVLGEIEQLLPDIAKTRWRKKSDFYTLFVKLAKHSAQLPLAADKRDKAAQLLIDFASTVDGMMREPDWGPDQQDTAGVYMANVIRAASDLGSRQKRELVLDKVLAPIFK